MKSAIEVFGEWAQSGRDERMAQGHLLTVQHMISLVTLERDQPFTVIDAGCGNGWVVRMLNKMELCLQAEGVDGALEMIEKAKKLDPEGRYECADLLAWRPVCPVDIVHSMEVFYYFKDPAALVQHIANHWLKPGGQLIAGVDHYLENTPSHNWASENGISHMTTLAESEWVALFNAAGLNDVQSSRFGAKGSWAGTLVLTGQVEG